MKNQLLAIFGIGAYILYFWSSKIHRPSGASAVGFEILVMMLVVSVIAVFIVMATVLLWKKARGLAIMLVAPVIILVIMEIILSIILSSLSCFIGGDIKIPCSAYELSYKYPLAMFIFRFVTHVLVTTHLVAFVLVIIKFIKSDFPLEEQIKTKWWHKLTKVLWWALTIGVLVFFISMALNAFIHCDRIDWLERCISELAARLFIGVMFALITYFLFWFIYKRVIIYKTKKDKN